MANTGLSTANIAGFALLRLSLSLAKNCYVPEASRQDAVPHLTTDSFLRQNTKLYESKSIIWPIRPIRIYQFPLAETPPLSLKLPLRRRHTFLACLCLLLSPSQTPSPPAFPSRLINLLCAENLASVCVLYQFRGTDLSFTHSSRHRMTDK